MGSKADAKQAKYAKQMMASKLAQDQTDPAEWAAWVVELLVELELRAMRLDPEHPQAYELGLERLSDAIADRLSKKQWGKGNQARKSALGARQCANCGNVLEPDEGHRSRVYLGSVCDGCYDLEK